MPTYRIGGRDVRRKNLYRPCIMDEEFDKAHAEGDDATIARLYKATAWADNITDSEWSVVLREEDAKPYNRSRLKKKAAGWLMALQRIARLHPELFEEIADLAQRTYHEQVKEDPPVLLVWEGWLFEDERPALVGHPVNWHPVADTPQLGDGDEGVSA
ncbi:MAG: hypothetical protein M3454_09435 [Actinomycetota bacterium]|nr:hypothetical protein [Actinomycetota bacterium]